MKLAIVRKKYTFHGGAEGFSQNLITRLAALGNEIHIYAIEWSGAPSRNIHYHKVPAIEFLSFLRDLSFLISSFFILRRDRKNLDIIQSHDKTLFQDIYRAGDGCHIEWLRQRWQRTGPLGKLSILFNPYHWLLLWVERMIFKGHRFRKVIAISNLVKRNILHNYNIDEGDIVVIYNWVDLERFHPGNRDRYRREIRTKYEIDDDEFVLLFVGSGFERKGMEYLIKAVELVPAPLTLLVVGKGREEKFRRYIKRQRVIFCGPRRETNQYYAAADIFVFPALYEPFGNVILEALASGLPVITTVQCGASELITCGREGFVVDGPEDIRAIARYITFLMDREEKRKMGIAARRVAERFSFDSYLVKMKELYDQDYDSKL